MGRLFKLILTLFIFIILVQIFPSIAANIKEEYAIFFENRVNVAAVKIEGHISDASEYIKQIRKHFENKHIKAILLQVESSGGVPGPSQAIFREIRSLKREHPTPVIALTSDVCTFSAYYIASASDYIVAAPAALIGGIGTYTEYFKSKDLLENWTGKSCSKYSLPSSDEVKNLSENIYKQFIKDIAISRKLSLKDTDKWANGLIFTADQALPLKLVDELGSEFNAIKKIRELALIEKNQKIHWVTNKKESAFNSLLN